MSLLERTDPAAEASKKLINQMIENIEDLRRLRNKTVKKRKAEVLKVEKTYTNKIDNIEKEIYNIENAIKQIYGAKEFFRFKKAHKEAQDREAKTKNINSGATDKDNNNNNNTDGV